MPMNLYGTPIGNFLNTVGLKDFLGSNTTRAPQPTTTAPPDGSGLTPVAVPKAPTDWSMTPDQASRVAADPRLRNLNRDELYLALQNRPASATGQRGVGDVAHDAYSNAMAWTPAHILGYVAQKVGHALGGD